MTTESIACPQRRADTPNHDHPGRPDAAQSHWTQGTGEYPMTTATFNAGEHYRRGRRDARDVIARLGVREVERVVATLEPHERDLPRAEKHIFWGFRSILLEHEEAHRAVNRNGE